ncbi:MAG TPA: gfo/Idh/MocA family oxidoreductase, partial [Terracidiphilus sp.]
MFPARILLAAALFTASVLSAQTAGQPSPLRVAIVGLEHGHVDGFLSSLQHVSDVQLVGVSDPD